MKKSYFRILIVLAVPTALAFVIDSPVFAADYIVTQLTDNSYVDEQPMINNGWVVWQGWDGNDYEVFLYDGQTIKQITNNSYNDAGPGGGPFVNANGHVVWSGQPEGSGTDLEIFLYDGSDINQITYNSYRDEYPKMDDDGNIMWRGYDGSNYHIFYYDGSGITNVSNGACLWVTEDLQINSNGDGVWVGVSLDGGIDGEIFLYDSTGTKQITDNTYDDVAPQINENGKIVYVGKAGPSGALEEIFLYDGFSSIRLTNNLVTDYQPDINGEDLIVWSRKVTVGYDILIYDGMDIIPIANYKGGWGEPKISNNGYVAWQGIDPNNSVDNKIHVWNGLTTTVLESNATNDRYHHINGNGDIVWQAHDSNSYQIFYAQLVTKQSIDAILAFFDESVANGTLYGRGKIHSHASFRLWLMREKLETAKWLLENEKTEAACKTLNLAYYRCDGEPKPKDFIEGEAVPELMEMIEELMVNFECE